MREFDLQDLQLPPVRFTYVKLASLDHNITVIRDDNLCFGFGTKLRKIFGLIQYLKDKKTQKVILHGNLHGNFLAAYSYVLNRNRFRVEVNAYSRDLDFRSANRIILGQHSHSLRLFSKRTEMLKILNANISDEESSSYQVPEFGFHFSAFSGLNHLWEAIQKKSPGAKTIFLEIGSGLTFLSAIQFYTGTDTIVCGVSVGESRDSFLSVMGNLVTKLGINANLCSGYHILNPLGKSRFAKQTAKDKKESIELYQTISIFIEPVYGIKTWQYFLDPKQIPENLPRPWFYLHQGGQLNHLDLIEK